MDIKDLIEIYGNMIKHYEDYETSSEYGQGFSRGAIDALKIVVEDLKEILEKREVKEK